MQLDNAKLEKVMGSTWPLVNLVFDRFPMAVTITDAGGYIVYCNQAQLEMDGLKPSDIIGRFLLDVYSPYTNSVILNCLSAQKPILNHWQVYNSINNQNIHANNQAFPLVFDGKLTGCIAFSKNYPKTGYDGYYQDHKPETKSTSQDVHFGKLIGSSPVFLRSIQTAKAVAENNLSVLIYGETGVGKELFARGIHNASSRCRRPFVAVNCSAVPDNLFEGLMFGVAKGAFTGATERAGFFEEANGGTIYLDEIDSMPVGLQPKFLRVLQEGEVRRLGSGVDIKLDVKVISSMAKDPMVLIQQGLIRSDLVFRLGAVLVPIPPLRDRPGDLPLLLNHFIAKHSSSLGKRINRASHDFMQLLQRSEWPGNVRELEHVITGAITLAKPRRQTLGVDLLPEYFKNIIFSHQTEIAQGDQNVAIHHPENQSSSPPDRVIANKERPNILSAEQRRQEQLDEEKTMILSVLETSFGNVALAARLLGLAPQILHYKIKKHGIDAKAFKDKFKHKKILKANHD